MTGQTFLERSAKIADEFRFLRSWVDNPLRTGAVSPSSRKLARAMAGFVPADSTGPVIELGPGTGVVTKALVDRGVSPDRLILVEFFDEFCDLLRKRFPEATVIGGDAYAVRSLLSGRDGAPVSAVISGLPLLTKPEITRSQLLQDCFSMMEPGAPFVQFTYGVQPPIPRKYAPAGSVNSTKRIWLNLPPARVYVYRRPEE